jgi:hypothetical protein
MSNNEGTLDRAVRIALGIALLSIVVIGPKTAWGLLGVVPLLTGLVGYCPLYGVLGVSTYTRSAMRQRRAH